MKGQRAALRIPLALIVLTLASSCEGSSPPQDPPLRTAEDFCRLYFERADPGAALPLTIGEARRLLLEETDLLAGQAPPGKAVAQVNVVGRHQESGDGVTFLVEVEVPPHTSQVRGTGTQIVTFDVVVSRDQDTAGSDWRVSAFRRH